MLSAATIVAIPLLMAAGCMANGLVGMAIYALAGVAATVSIHILTAGWLAARRLGADRARAVPPTVATLVEAAGVTQPRVYLFASGEAVPFTTGMGFAASLFVPESFVAVDGDLRPEVVGAVAHEIAHIRRNDFFTKLLLQAVAVALLSSSIISPVGALWPELFRLFSLSELFVLIGVPMASWLGLTAFLDGMRRIELAADRTAASLCGAEVVERALRTCCDDDPGGLSALIYPSLRDRLRALARP